MSNTSGGLAVVPSECCFATPTTSAAAAEISPAGYSATSKSGVNSKALSDYFMKMMRVQIQNDHTNISPTFSLETPNPKMIYCGGPLDLPTTAELMQRCLTMNPFEAKFKEANEKINNGIGMPPTNSTYEAMEANGLVPMAGTSGCLPTSASVSDFLLKIPPPTTINQQSPNIFANIQILSADPTTRENLKTADISKLFGSAVNPGDNSVQAPRTADVLNAVLDMHSDRLATINYLNKPDFSALLRSPANSAPNSASVLGIPSTSAYQQATAQVSQAQKSPNLGGIGNSGQWDGMKIVKKEDFYGGANNTGELELNLMGNGNNGVGVQSTSESDREVTPLSTPGGGGGNNPVGRPPNSSNGTPGRGRGRGRSTTADMQPDERRNTILERNKAAAVRYRKRKKEEHDDMIGRVHGLETEKNQLMTQNQVLRRELDRVTALLREREQRCVCLKGMPLSSDGAAGIDVLGMYNNSSNSNTEMHQISSHKRQKM